MKTIKILSHDVTVTEEDPSMWSEGGMGRSYIKTGQIVLNKTMQQDSKRSTMIHEAVHYISDLTSSDLTEQQIDAVAVGMFSLLKDNPEFIKELFYGKK